MPKTIIRYAQGQSDDLAPLKSVGIDDDSATAWWGGGQKCFASVALAAVLTSTALATVCGQQVSQGDQSDVPGTLVNLKVDEDYWQNLERPIASNLYQALPYFFDPAEIVPAPAVFQPDEDVWLNPTLPAQSVSHVLLPLGDPEEIPAASLYGQPDEDLWRNPVAPVAASLAWPQQWAFDVQESAGSLFGQFDEDFWRNPVAPVAANLYHSPLLGDQEEIPGALLFGQPPEEYWKNPTRPVAASLYQSLPYFFDPADFVPLIVPEFDEDFWQSGVAPVPPSLYRSPIFRDPEEVPGALLKSQAVDEYYWQNWVQPVAATLYQQFPYLFDSGELNTQGQNGTALPAGQALVIASNNPTASTGTQAPGGSLPARRRGRGGVSSGPPPIIFGIARPAGLSLRADHGKVSASGSARAKVAVPAVRIDVGQPTAKGIKNPTAEELMAILMGL